MNDEVKNLNQVIKTLSLNHEGKSFVNMNDEVKNPNQVIKTLSLDRKSTRLNSSHERRSRMPSSA